MINETNQPVVRKFSDSPPDPIIPPNIFSNTLTFLDIDEKELARQMTLIDFEMFQKIKPFELLNQAWSKPKLRHRAVNVLGMIRRFNVVSCWVATEILALPCVRDRARIMTKFIKIAEEAATLRNWNTVMSITAGLNFSSVHRLKFTFDEVPAAQQRAKVELDRITATEGNFKAYRAMLATQPPPCLPYLGVHLTDLTFMDENPDNYGHLINFSKRTLIFNIISLLQQYQQTAFNLQPVHQILNYLQKLHGSDDQELYHLSLKWEPRGAVRTDIV